ncbi:MAG: hypothetical protein ACPG19_00690 [Saprospiraceae bacterium]
MRNNQLIWLNITVMILICFSCSKEVDESIVLKEYLKTINIHNIEIFDYYIILPIDNCSACINKYKRFVALNMDIDNLKIIICSADKKKAKILSGSSTNIVIDKKYNLSIKYPLIDNSVKVFKIKDKKIKNSFELKPSELPLNEIFTSVY